MAFKINSDAQVLFYAKVFGQGHDVVQKVKALIGAGVTFETGLFTLRAVGAAKGQIKLTTGPTTLMKTNVDPAVMAQNKGLIAGWVSKLYEQAGSPAAYAGATAPSHVQLGINGVEGGKLLYVIKAVRDITGLNLKDAKDLAEKAKHGAAVVVLEGVTLTVAVAKQAILKQAGAETFIKVDGVPFDEAVYKAHAAPTAAPVAVKPVDTVISLKDAQALGQKVHGTSGGSVYYCVAVSDHVKVAARMYKGGSISLRAEWTDNPKADIDKLAAAGLQMKSNYASLHFDAADVPLARVIGAFLIGTGINWKSMIMNGQDLVIGDKL